MSIQYAQDIIKRIGPGHITLDRSLYDDLATELALAGAVPHDLGDGPVGGALLIDWPLPNMRVLDGFKTLILLAGDSDRRTVEGALFAAGWRRHAGGMLTGQVAAWTDDRLPHTSFYQRAEADASAGPLQASGHAADAFIARYALANQYVRAGDHVLVDGADARHGIDILAALSRGSRFTAINDLPVEPDSPFRLDGLADNSIDLIVAFAPPAENWQIALAEYARVLRLDGRIVVGWPAGAKDDSAPASWAELTEFAEQLFLSELRFAQSERGRALHPVAPEGPDSDWLMLVAAAEPLAGIEHRATFTHPGFPADGDRSQPVLVDFANAYDNPWLYRAMVQLGERLNNPIKLAALAEHVIQQSRPDSVDRGAALSVLGYRVLEMRMIDGARAILGLIGDYFGATQGGNRPPHVVRWRVSLAFLAGRLCELLEQRADALGWYDKAAGDDWADFSPILATKTIAACFHGGRLSLSDGDMAGATRRFRRGVDVGQRVAAADHAGQIGSADRPLPFYFQELAEVLDMASQCANALFHLPLWDRDPGLYWRQVDVKRFGVASWALDLERENQRLRSMLG